MFVPNVVFGWASVSTHPTLMERALKDPSIYSTSDPNCLVRSLLSSSQIDTISGFTGDNKPTNDFSPYHGHWEEFANRAYYTDPQWAGLTDETTKLCYLMHNATDSGVPINHNPAQPVYNGGWDGLVGVESELEAQVGTWLTYPTIAGTSTVSSVSGTFSYLGTYTDIVQTHIQAVQANAAWFRDQPEATFLGIGLGYKTSDANRTAGTAGTTQAMLFARAFVTDYLLQKKVTIANAGSSYTIGQGQSITLSSAGSQDPDSVSWGGNGTFANNYGGLTNFAWDINNDGNYGEVTGANPTLTYNELKSLAGGTGSGKTIHLRVTDDEGSVGFATATLNILTVPEPGSLTLLLVFATVLCGFLRLRRSPR
jgi:hypothetical protein